MGSPVRLSWRVHRIIHALTLAALALLCGQAAGGEPASFNESRTDTTLLIEATLEGRPVDATGQVRVALRGAKGTVSGTSTDLRRKDSGQAIPVKQITVEDKNIEPGAAVPMNVTVRGIDRPGTYEGTITLALPPPDPATPQTSPADGQPRAVTESKVTLTLVVSAKPQIESPDTSVAAAFSNCIRSCSFSEFVSPGSVSGAETSIVIVNKSPTALEIKGKIDLKGSTHTSVTKSVDAKKPNLITIQPGERQRIYFDFEGKEDFVADHFTGNAVFTASVAGQAAAASVGGDGAVTLTNRTVLSIPATVDVRDAALIPFLAILLGVLAGRFGKIFGSAARNARVELFTQYTFLGSQIETLQDAAARQNCQGQLNDIWSHVLREDATDAKFAQQFKDLGTKTDLLLKLEALEQQLNASALPDEDKNPIRQHLQTVRTNLFAAAPDFNAAQAAIVAASNEIQAAVQHAAELTAHQLVAAIPLLAVQSLTAVTDDLMRGIATRRVAARRQQGPFRNAMNTLLLLFSGIDSTDTIAFQVWFVRPLVYLVTIIVLSFYGLWILYGGTEHATFGAKGYPEYIALFLWGIAAQTVSMTLADVQFTRRP
jgi:hypothetical protein